MTITKSSSRINIETTKILNSYLSLEEGWDYGLGELITKDIINNAVDICVIGEAYGYNVEPHPLTSGGICLVFHSDNNNSFLDVSINPNKTLDYRIEEGKGVDYELISERENVDLNEIERALLEIKSTCDISGFLNLLSIPQSKNDSKVTPSVITMEEYQSSGVNVLFQYPAVFANIYQTTIAPVQLARPLYTQ